MGELPWLKTLTATSSPTTPTPTPRARRIATLRIINDGATETNLYADIYVFDDSEELQECCSCVISPDGLLSESVNGSLTHNPLNKLKLPTRGVIKVIASSTPGAAATGGPIIFTVSDTPSPGLHGWATHVQKLVSGYALTEDELADALLVKSEESLLQETCLFDLALIRLPRSCTLEDQDF